jgi:hypothetical protein
MFQKEITKKESKMNEVKIVGIEIPFMDMVRFIFWSTIAAIPALIMLGLTGLIVGGFLSSL